MPAYRSERDAGVDADDQDDLGNVHDEPDGVKGLDNRPRTATVEIVDEDNEPSPPFSGLFAFDMPNSAQVTKSREVAMQHRDHAQVLLVIGQLEVRGHSVGDRVAPKIPGAHEQPRAEGCGSQGYAATKEALENLLQGLEANLR